MAKLIIHPGQPLRGTTTVPGDKSISHRVLMLGALAAGQTQVRGWLPAGDTKATLGAVQSLGVKITPLDESTLTIHGGTLQQPQTPLDFVHAGTGIRLMAGIMAGMPFPSVLDGSAQLRRRPMKRITDPLRQMGADIQDTDGKCPLVVKPARLKGIAFEQTIPSAQVKSSLLLAGLFAEGETTVIEPAPGRDHTERMLAAMGAPITITGSKITLQPCFNVGVTLQPIVELKPFHLTVPADFSSAAFLLVAASIIPRSQITLMGINTNSRRTGLLDVLERMGAQAAIANPRQEGGEPVADLSVRWQLLHGTTVGGEEVVRMIDEFPILMVAAAQAEGEVVVKDAAELRVKESDRLAVMASELAKMGIRLTERADGFVLRGKQTLKGGVVDSHDDHRIAMSLAIAGLAAENETIIEDAGCIHDSFPGFEDILAKLGANVTWQN